MITRLIPNLRYENCPKAMVWLEKAFGFKKLFEVNGPNETIVHAQLRLGEAMIMVSSVIDSEFGKLLASPKALNGYNTMGIYVVVEEIDEHYAQSAGEGAEILLPIKDQEYGGRVYTCKDPEGYVWSFGSYDPFAE